MAAEGLVAPIRMGLSATPERADGLHSALDALVGPVVYQSLPTDFGGEHLAHFELQRVLVDMTPSEEMEYQQLTAEYSTFLDDNNLRGFGAAAYQQVMYRVNRNPAAMRAWQARQRARLIADNSQNKLLALKNILVSHRGLKIIIFNENTATVELIARQFVVPFLTYKTSQAERRFILEGFSTGRFRVLATSRILDEGVDVPDAAIGVIVSGTAQSRQFIQRLGRILRPFVDQDGTEKQAILYEIVTRGTGEYHRSQQRRRVVRG
jgi:superfamily II DNA or RNA helicase